MASKASESVTTSPGSRQIVQTTSGTGVGAGVGSGVGLNVGADVGTENKTKMVSSRPGEKTERDLAMSSK